MVDNKNVRSQSNSSTAKSKYVLADGQRVPVLFRLKNVQGRGAGLKLHAEETTAGLASAKPDRLAEHAPGMESQVSVTPPVAVAEPAQVGPSWLRRNAYRGTVLLLLLITILLLNNNRKQSVGSPQLAATKNSDQSAATSNVPATEVESPSQSEKPQVAALVSSLTPTEESTAVASDSSNSQDHTAASSPTKQPTTIVETTTTDSSTKILISSSSQNSNDSMTAKATLLAPQILKQEAASKPHPWVQLLATAKSDSPTSVTVVNSSLANSTGVESTSSPATREPSQLTNRYQVVPGETQSLPTDIPTTDAPALDPSALFALNQSYQGQSPTQTVQAMRQASMSTAPQGAQWHSIPVSNQAPYGSYPSLYAPQPTPSGVNGSGPNVPRQPAYQPISNNNFIPNQPTNTNSVLPNSAAGINSSPARTGYNAVYPEYANPGDTQLYSTPSMPSGTQQTAPQKPAQYQPLYPTLNQNVPANNNSMSSQLYDVPDQSVGAENYSLPQQ